MYKKLQHTTGFTLIELVMVMVILGIVAMVVVPRFGNNTIFQARGFADQVLATLRYAQKTAIAQHRHVCVNLTVTTLTLTIDKNAVCDSSLSLPDDKLNLKTPANSITLTTTVTPLTFDALGKPNSGATITVSGVSQAITVEAETGYVHQ